MKYKLIKDQWYIMIIKDVEKMDDSIYKQRGFIVSIIKCFDALNWVKVGNGYSYEDGQDIFESDDLEEVKQMANLEVL